MFASLHLLIIYNLPVRVYTEYHNYTPMTLIDRFLRNSLVNGKNTSQLLLLSIN